MVGASRKLRSEGIELIIFDCDGVLVDSEPLAIAVLRETVEKLGVRLDAASAYRDFLGRSLTAVSEGLRAGYGVELPQSAIEAMRNRLFMRYRQDLAPMAGVHDMLDRLGRRACVASSSHMERIALSLQLTGLYDYFAPHIFSASMVENGKPAPDLFLYAAEEMGVAPGRCVVIEDSPAGIAAAQAAGMKVIAFTGGSHIAPAGLEATISDLDPDFIARDFQTLHDLLELGGNQTSNG